MGDETKLIEPTFPALAAIDRGELSTLHAAPSGHAGDHRHHFPTVTACQVDVHQPPLVSFQQLGDEGAPLAWPERRSTCHQVGNHFGFGRVHQSRQDPLADPNPLLNQR